MGLNLKEKTPVSYHRGFPVLERDSLTCLAWASHALASQDSSGLILPRQDLPCHALLLEHTGQVKWDA